MTDRPYGLFHQPRNTLAKITEIWAVVSVDPEDENEGVCAMKMGDSWMPMIAADPKRLEFIKAQAARLAAATGQKMKLVKFTTREEVEDIG